MATVFTKIIAGELPAHFVWKDDVCVAFLSINPLKDGHVLVVPRKEIDHWVDLDAATRDHLFGVAQRIGRALHGIYAPEKVGLMLAGLEVPHVHLHVVPIWGVNDLDFANAAKQVDQGALASEAAKIRAALEA
jgi:diadenosine tetraphosphate (Ap4A) HIT family hydrolase